MLCPQCRQELRPVRGAGAGLQACRACGSLWLDAGLAPAGPTGDRAWPPSPPEHPDRAGGRYLAKLGRRSFARQHRPLVRTERGGRPAPPIFVN